MKKHSLALVENSKGQGLTEYLILLILIAIVSIGMAQSFGKVVRTKIKEAKEKINSELTIDNRGSGSGSGGGFGGDSPGE